MKSSRQEPQTIGEQAAQWLCVLAEGGAREQADFLAWLKQSPRHVEEFLFATATWKKLRQIGASRPMDVDAIVAEALGSDAATNVVALKERVAGSLPSAAGRSHMRWAAVFAALIVAGAFGWWLYNSGRTYATAVGEQRTVRLADGSVLYLNTDSRTRVDFSPESREIELFGGEALFVVAQDRTRPFRVTAGATVIQAVGTQFNVRRRAGDTQVSVLEGKVKIALQKSPQFLAAGEEATVASSGRIVKHNAPDISKSVAWRERRLVFTAERLEDVVAEINRYSARQFHIEGERARDTRLTATFAIDNPESLAAFLEKYSDLSVEARGEDFVIDQR